MSDSLQLHGLYVVHQALLSMGFSRQEYWSGLPFPSPRDPPNPGIDLSLLHCRQILYQLTYRESPSSEGCQKRHLWSGDIYDKTWKLRILWGKAPGGKVIFKKSCMKNNKMVHTSKAIFSFSSISACILLFHLTETNLWKVFCFGVLSTKCVQLLVYVSPSPFCHTG